MTQSRLMAQAAFRAVLIASLTALSTSAAIAQFGSIFGDPPPRPPGSVPGGRQPMTAPPQQDSYPPPPPQDYSYPPPSRATPSPQSGPYGPYGGVQSQPLPPPPGTPAARQPVTPAPSTLQPPAKQPPPAPTQPAVTAAPAADEVVAEPSAQRIENPKALFSGLDKITGRIINFDVAIGETVQFGALQLTTRACYTRPPTETANTDAFVEVDEVTLQGEVRRIFTGWMFAASPGLHAVEHPIYDLWLTDCKGGTQTVAADATESTAAETPRAQKRAPQRAQPRPPVRRPPPRP
jgi:hypothetical protein